MSPRPAGKIRPSQIITTFGPGAVVDLPRLSVIMAGTEEWVPDATASIEEPRLRAALRVEYLYPPPAGRGRNVPSLLFPEYLVCSRCHLLARSSSFAFAGGGFSCTRLTHGSHRPDAFPARFLVACTEGHMDDFPWRRYVHGGSVACERDLHLQDSGRTGSLRDIRASCGCGASRSMGDAFSPQAAGVLGPCSGRRPWLGRDEREDCRVKRQRTLLRGASNAYFSVIRSALWIPRSGRENLEDLVDRLMPNLEEAETLQDLEQARRFIPELQGRDLGQVFEILQQRRQGSTSPSRDHQSILREEWEAFQQLGPVGGDLASEFEVEETTVPERWHRWLTRAVLVSRLKEVQVLTGFSRIDSTRDLTDEDSELIRIQRLSRRRQNWLPAVELRGEGIFLQFDEQVLQEWESRPAVMQTTGAMQRAHENWRAERDLPPAPFPGARYVLLHGIAHLLIRQLSLDCGYSSTAIRERIYSSDSPASPRAGVMLYTASPDSDGSLGGLVDMGTPDRLGPLLSHALEQAAVCSSDPLCADRDPRSTGNLNGAACHACLLIAETSCERSNRYLDRNLIVPTVHAGGAVFFAS